MSTCLHLPQSLSPILDSVVLDHSCSRALILLKFYLMGSILLPPELGSGGSICTSCCCFIPLINWSLFNVGEGVLIHLDGKQSTGLHGLVPVGTILLSFQSLSGYAYCRRRSRDRVHSNRTVFYSIVSDLYCSRILVFFHDRKHKKVF